MLRYKDTKVQYIRRNATATSEQQQTGLRTKARASSSFVFRTCLIEVRYRLFPAPTPKSLQLLRSLASLDDQPNQSAASV